MKVPPTKTPGAAPAGDLRTLVRLLRLLAPFRGWLLLGAAAALLTLIANVALMATSGWFISAMAAAGAAGVSMNYFTPAALIRLCAIARTGGRYLERILTHEATFRLLSHLRVWLYRHLEPLAPAGLERLHSGDLLSRIRSDVDTLENLYLRTLVPLVAALAGALLLGAYLATYDRSLALALIGLLAVGGILIPILTGSMGAAPGRRAVAIGAELREVAVDGVQGLPELLVYGAAEAQAKRLDALSDELAQCQVRLGRGSGLGLAGIGLSANLALWAMLILGIPMLREGRIAPPDLALIALFALAAFESVAPLPGALLHLGSALTAARRLFAIVDAPPAVAEPAIAVPPPRGLDLHLEGLRFQYPGSDRPALDGIDLDLPQGRRMAVVGASGSGKSTLLAMLLRFRAPDAGEIRLGGLDLAQWSGEALRSRVTLVSQHTHLFDATIRENLLLARPDATQAELDLACRAAGIDAFVASLPERYDTWAGETGVRFSGGEARRIAVARAFLRDSPILLLDEPTEGLDAESERALLRSVERLSAGRTLLLVTHRPLGLESMDEILVLDEGRISARGTYAELIAGGCLPSLLRSEPNSA